MKLILRLSTIDDKLIKVDEADSEDGHLFYKFDIEITDAFIICQVKLTDDSKGQVHIIDECKDYKSARRVLLSAYKHFHDELPNDIKESKLIKKIGKSLLKYDMTVYNYGLIISPYEEITIVSLDDCKGWDTI
jgi:hypothetical protein